MNKVRIVMRETTKRCKSEIIELKNIITKLKISVEILTATRSTRRQDL